MLFFNRRRSWLVAVLVTVVALSAWYFQPRTDAIAYWQQQLLELPEEEVPAILQQLAARGDVGLQVLAAAVGSSRTMVVSAAENQLHAELTAWRRLPANLAGPRLEVLAEALAANVDQYEPDARSWAAEVAEQVLLWPREAHGPLPAQLARHCHRLLEAAEDAPETSEATRRAAEQRIQALHEPLAAHALQAPQSDALDAPLPPTPDDVHAPQPLPPPSRTPQPAPIPTNSTLPTSSAPSSTETVQASASRPLEPLPRIVSLQAINPIELFKHAHGAASHEREAIEAEFRRRKFTQIQIDLGMGVTDADPRVRRQWAEALPSLAGVDAKPWLLWLCNDTEPEVRRSVITIMATSGDLELQGRVARASREDGDDRVREAAVRLLSR